jgi:DUF917 family protein
MWELAEKDLEALATGAAILGAGGGGNPYLGRLRVQASLRLGLSVRVMEPDELHDEAVVVSAGGMGSPLVSYEKIPQGEEESRAVRALAEHLGCTFDAVAPLEMGGGNSMAALVVGAALGIPVLNGDGMGRAFPQLHMLTYLFYGGSPAPAAMADEKGNSLVFTHLADAETLEALARQVTIQMGGHAGVAVPVMDGLHCKQTIVPGTLRLAHDIGRAVMEARMRKSDPSAAILAVTGGRRYLRGKVIDVERRIAGGFASGRVVIEGLDGDTGRQAEIDFQNENLILWEGVEPRVMVPDLITLVTTDRGEPLTTEVVRYGYRTDVLVIPSAAQLRTDMALSIVGPRAFGYEFDYRSFDGEIARGGG